MKKKQIFMLFFFMIKIEEFTVFSPAKVNLHLAVKDRRPDGFHDLESVFLTLNFGDTLYFSVKNEEQSRQSKGFGDDKCEIEGVFIPGNIILKAVSLFREKTGFSNGLNIRVDKRIPLGGGLGGGSSNAASALLAMNKIAGSPLKKFELLEAGASLGSDVPFFIHETPAAWVTGRGENIEPIEAVKMFLVLVNPGFPSDTKTAFKLLDEHRKSGTRSEKPGTKNNYIKNSSLLIPNPLFSNDFLDVFPKEQRNIYNEIISSLRELGAVYANLSGAGSTCFGIFEDQEKGKIAADVLQKKWEFACSCLSV